MLQEKEIGSLQDSISHLRDEGKYEEAAIAVKELLDMATSKDDCQAVLSALYTSTLIHYRLGNFDQVLKHIEDHHYCCLSCGTKEDLMCAYYLQYFISIFSQDYEQSKALLNNMLSIALETENRQYVCIAYYNLSCVYNKLETYEDALKAAQNAVKYAGDYIDERPILAIRAYLHLIESSLNLNRDDMAMTGIDCLEKLSFLQKHAREQALLKVLKGRLYEKLGQPAEAFHFYTKAREYKELRYDFLLQKEIQQKRIALAEELCSHDELAEIQKDYIELLHKLEDQKWLQSVVELNLRLQNSTKKRKEHIDYLTGVYNRRYLEKTVNRWLGTDRSLCESVVCLAFDIDNLKAINDTYGHLAGDEAIKLIANTCSELIRKEDVLARFGGDEFVLAMRGISLQDAEKKALLLAEKIEESSIKSEAFPVPVTISAGLADNQLRDIESFRDLFHLADMALYKAKKNGKNQVASFK